MPSRRDAPERVWADLFVGDGYGNMGTMCFDVQHEPHLTEYIRADTHEAEVARLREALEKARAAIAANREADKPQSVLGMEVRVSPYIPRNVICVGREITPEEWGAMLRKASCGE